MLSIAIMATSLVTSFLVPLLKKSADGLGTELQQRTTKSAADGLVKVAQRLWARVKGEARTSDDQQIVSMFEKQPELMQEALQKIVQRQLEQDEGFRKDVAALLESEAEPGVANWMLMGEIVGVVDARGATISGGNTAGVIYNASDRASTSKQGTDANPAREQPREG
jgi:hypothetical protein